MGVVEVALKLLERTHLLHAERKKGKPVHDAPNVPA
jgi:hypothetical protein